MGIHYHDDDSLTNVFEAKADVFSILSLNCQSLNAKIDQINIKLQQLKSNGHEFSAICLQETRLSEDSDISLLEIDGYTFIPQGKICSAHGGLAYRTIPSNFSMSMILQITAACPVDQQN